MPSPPPGRMINLGSHAVHLLCAGHGTPTVVFDAALGASSLSWSLVWPAVSRLTHACAYDRAGFGWSAAGPMPRTAGRIADELHALLQAGGVRPPYVLVGHSFGGLVAQLFTARHRGDVEGLVLIEPAIPDEWAEPAPERRALIDRGTRLCRYGATAARLRLARAVSALVRLGALAPARALVALVSRGGLKREDEGILAPVWKLPPESRAVLREMWVQPKFFEALGSQIASICESAAQVAREPADLRDMPLVVLTAESASAGRLAHDASLAARSTRGRHVLVPDSGHWIPLDAPQAVVNGVAALVRGGN